MKKKAILMSIRPQYVAKILNGEKTIEVRKKFPKDYVGWIYIYCTKGKRKRKGTVVWYALGKVVARFWCDKVEEIRCSWGSNFIDWSKYPSDERYDYYIGNEMDTCDICRVACLKMEELDNYLKSKKGYAIYISKLEVFDKPKELKEFRVLGNCKKCSVEHSCSSTFRNFCSHKVEKAPQSWYYIEGE